MPSETRTDFKLAVGTVSLELAGTCDFVERQLLRLKSPLTALVEGFGSAGGGRDRVGPRTATQNGSISFDEFYAERPCRDGRGAIQHRILLFTYFLQRVEDKHAVRRRDVAWCFSRAGLRAPKNLSGVLGHMRRALGYLEPGEERGLYRLSPKGVQFVEERFKPV